MLKKKKMQLSIEDHIKEIIHEKLMVPIEKIIPQANFIDDLGADSLDTVELVMAFEDEFDIEIPNEDAEKFKIVKDVLKYIDAKK